VTFSLTGDTHLSGAISCDNVQTTIVLFNNVGLRVRTITISREGEARDEIAYLSPDDSPLEEILALLATAWESDCHCAQSNTFRAEIDPSER